MAVQRHLLPRQLRPLRLKRHLTLRAVSLQTGIPIQSLSVYERLEVEPPISRLVQLAALYTVSLDALFQPAKKALGGLLLLAGLWP